MLQAIRSSASSLFFKLLFGVLVLSFGIWGIGDIFRSRGVDTTVASVGSRKIETQELTQAVHESVDELRKMFRGAPLDPEMLKQRGFVSDVLERIVNRDLVDLEASRLGLAIGNDTVRQAILTNRNFVNRDGVFDRNVYVDQLQSQHKSEAQFEELLRGDLTRAQIVSAVVAGVSAPPELVGALYQQRAERRVAEVATIPPGAAAAPGEPGDADLAAAYERHKVAFRVPELRSFTVALLLVDDLAAANKPSDEQLRQEYQTRAAEFTTPERRRLQQILLPDEAKGKEAAQLLASGKDFAAVAKEVAGTPADKLDLDFFARDDLPPKLGDAAFALKLDETTEPIQDELGWHILRLTEIKPEETKPFEEVKDKLATEVARDAAGDQIAKTANAIDDKVAGGAAFGEVVESFGLKPTRVETVDKDGRDASGKTVELPQPGADVLRVAFATESGQSSQLTEIGEAGYFLVQVDKVTPETFKPLDEVRPQVVEFWQADQREAALEKLAAGIAEQINNGAKLADVAAERKLATFTSKPLQRAGGDAAVPPAVVAKIFEAKPGSAVYARGSDGYAVALVTEVLPPDPAVADAEQAKLAQQLTPALQDDIFQQFDTALRKRYPVNINPEALSRAF